MSSTVTVRPVTGGDSRRGAIASPPAGAAFPQGVRAAHHRNEKELDKKYMFFLPSRYAYCYCEGVPRGTQRFTSRQEGVSKRAG